MKTKKVNILGEEYTINIDVNSKDNPLMETCYGFCDDTIKEINIGQFDKDESTLSDIKKFEDKVLRHEIVHAFIKESGLAEESKWAMNEEMVDFFARQFPKMTKAMIETECLDTESQNSSDGLEKVLKGGL